MPRQDHMQPVPSVTLRVSQGHYAQYILRPQGNNADMSYTDESTTILTQANFANPNLLEWRLKSGSNVTGGFTLTVHDASDQLLTAFVKTGNPAPPRESYMVVVNFIGAVRYDLEINLRDGADQLVRPLANSTLTGPQNGMESMGLIVGVGA
jgi:hypothetical protein